jgi:hypothetical protein
VSLEGAPYTRHAPGRMLCVASLPACVRESAIYAGLATVDSCTPAIRAVTLLVCLTKCVLAPHSTGSTGRLSVCMRVYRTRPRNRLGSAATVCRSRTGRQGRSIRCGWQACSESLVSEVASQYVPARPCLYIGGGMSCILQDSRRHSQRSSIIHRMQQSETSQFGSVCKGMYGNASRCT